MKQEKQLLLDEIQGQMRQRPSFILLQYAGFGANALNEFRTAIAKQGGDVGVMNKRLLIKAAENMGIKLARRDLDGHIAVVHADEESALDTAKYVFQFSKESEGKVKVVGGHIDGLLYSAEQVDVLSKLPSKQEMRAQLLATFEAPMAQLLAVCEALLTSVPHCLENKAKLESGEAAAS